MEREHRGAHQTKQDPASSYLGTSYSAIMLVFMHMNHLSLSLSLSHTHTDTHTRILCCYQHPQAAWGLVQHIDANAQSYTGT